jgi:hypothetical protein
MNLIKFKRGTSSNVEASITSEEDSLERQREELLAKPSVQSKKSGIFQKFAVVILVLAITATGTFTFTARTNKAEAATFGLGNDYNQILELNERLSNNVPVPIETISLTHTTGDKRVVALLLLFQKYQSPMASPSVAKAFVDSADRYGFGDKWALLPAISGIESAFGKITPYKPGKPSHNAWGWGGPGNWHYFESWEDAADKISRGIARGYGATGLNPERMMASYCPPCAKSGGHWAKVVNQYMAEANAIYKSL